MASRKKYLKLIVLSALSTAILVILLASHHQNDDLVHVSVMKADVGHQSGSGNCSKNVLGQRDMATLSSEDPEDVLLTVKLSGKETLFLYAAYFDDRGVFSSVYVRLTGMLHRQYLDQLDKLYCYIWFSGSDDAVSVKAAGDVIWKYDGRYQAVMISCPLTRKPYKRDSGGVPEAASVGEVRFPKTRSALNIRRKTGAASNGEGVAICTKVTYGRPDPVRLIEWIEVNRILGARTIYIYNASVQGEANRVLERYSELGLVTLRQHSFPVALTQLVFKETFPTSDYSQNWELEVLSINDCLYTAVEPFLVVIDIDEVLYPDGRLSGFVASDLVKYAADVVSFVFHTAVYSDELVPDGNATGVPSYLHTVLYNRRTRIDWESPKSITRRRLCIYHAHHMCFRSADGFRLRYDVDHKFGHVRHYRRRCRLTGEPNKCAKLLQNPERDRSMDALAPDLTERVRNVLVDLGMYEKLGLS